MTETTVNLKDRRLRTFTAMREMMLRYYMNAKMNEGVTPVAWITSGAPVELLYALDVIPIYPENHGALIGSAKMGPTLAAEAETLGFSPDLCSYARCDIGQAITGQGPFGPLARPDFVLCCNNICGTVLKWYEELARMFKVPLLMLDTPFLYDGPKEEAFRYVGAQVRHLVTRLEEITKKKLDIDRLREVGKLSREGIDLWNTCLQRCEQRPAPMSCFDAFVQLAPIVTLRGTAECNDYYRMLLAELDERVAGKFGAIPSERYRLLWDNIPIWYEMSRLSELFAAHEACLVADTYTNAWADNVISDQLDLDELARVYTTIYLNKNLAAMTDIIEKLARRFSVDGVVLHSNRSCKPYSIGQYDIQRLLEERMGLPTLVIDGDMTDSRQYAHDQTKVRIEAFLEVVAARGGK